MLGGICIAIIVAVAPRTVHITTQLHAGEWAHVRPERNTHGSVTYTFTTVPAANAATASRTLAEATAHVYDISRFGEVYEYVCCPFLHPFLCCDFPHSSWFHTHTGDVVAAGLAGPRTGEPQLEHVAVHDAELHARHLHPSDTHSAQPRRHQQPRVCVWSLCLSLFFFSTVFITDKPTHRAFKKWLMDGTAVDKKHLVFSLDHAYEISTAIQIVCSLSKKQLSLIASPDIN